MTIEQADKIADVILSAPEVYGAPPTMFPPASGIKSGRVWGEGNVKNSAWLIGLPVPNEKPVGSGVYSCRYGFRESYSSIISTWGYTDFGTSGGSGRYVTFDDIKMMAYVGIENYRAKILGHRWRFNEKGINTVNDYSNAYRRGSIVRQDDGKRWVKCRDKNVMPIPGVTIDGWVGRNDPFYWVAMTRRQGFKKPLVEHIPLLAGVSVPLDKVTRFVKAATIVGQNDLVQLRNVWDQSSLGETHSNAFSLSSDYPLNGEGRMVVYISEVDGLDKERDESVVEEKSIVWVTSNTLPVYNAYYNTKSGEQRSWSSLSPIQSLKELSASIDMRDYGMWTNHVCAFRSDFIPLAEGRTYYVYIKREESRAGCFRRSDFPADGDAGGRLVVVRVKTDTLARRF